jgi:aspartokinase-like uncharacterized kinase
MNKSAPLLATESKADRPRRSLTIVKLGGSHALQPHLRPWLAALAKCGGRVIIVPGGGPFADQVREAQGAMGFDDRAAHRMALLAMEQFGAAICSLEPSLFGAASLKAIQDALRARRTPVWAPAKMTLAADDLPQSWDLTSDSLAAWLAGRTGARRVALIKHGAPFGDPPDLDDLVARGIIDPLFQRMLRSARAEAFFAGPTDHAKIGEITGAPASPRANLTSGR